MEIKDGRITILVDGDATKIEIYDSKASSTIMKVELTPEQLSTALSRLSRTECKKVELLNTDKAGKKMIHKEFSFEIPNNFALRYKKKMALDIAEEKCPNGWKPDLSFSSQDSFFQKNGRLYARTTIRKWIKRNPTKGEQNG